MIRLITFICVIAAGAVAFGLYQLKYEVSRLEREAQSLNRTIMADRESIRILNAEWAYLNQPARLQEMATRFTALKAPTAHQSMMIADLPLRTLPSDLSVDETVESQPQHPAPAPKAGAKAAPKHGAAKPAKPAQTATPKRQVPALAAQTASVSGAEPKAGAITSTNLGDAE